MTVVIRRASILLAAVLVSSVSGASAADAVGVVRTTDIEWTSAGQDLPTGTQKAVLAGDPSKAEAFTLRLKFPPGSKVMPHVHPGTEHVTVLQGRLGIGSGSTFDEAKLQWLHHGDTFWVEKDAPHFGMATSEVIIEIHATGPWGLTYVNAGGAAAAPGNSLGR